MELSKRTGVAMVATRCVMRLHGSVSFVVIVIVVIKLVVVSVVFKLVIVIVVRSNLFLPMQLGFFPLVYSHSLNFQWSAGTYKLCI